MRSTLIPANSPAAEWHVRPGDPPATGTALAASVPAIVSPGAHGVVVGEHDPA